MSPRQEASPLWSLSVVIYKHRVDVLHLSVLVWVCQQFLVWNLMHGQYITLSNQYLKQRNLNLLSLTFAAVLSFLCVCVLCRAKYFRGKMLNGTCEIRVEQVGISGEGKRLARPAPQRHLTVHNGASHWYRWIFKVHTSSLFGIPWKRPTKCGITWPCHKSSASLLSYDIDL